MGGLLDALAKAQPAERTLTLCLNAPLLEQLEQAESEARTAEAASQARVERKAETAANRGKVRKYREAADALRAQVQEESVQVRLRALPSHRYNALVLGHPPRKNIAVDQQYGFNATSFSDALVRASIVDPVLDDAQWARLVEVVNDATWDLLFGAALALNRGRDAAVPFSVTGS